jgi:N-formylglutamate amidohydrolase
VLDVPHAGLVKPPEWRTRLPDVVWQRSADLYVDDLFADAPAQGASLLVARFPRTFLDVNRDREDVDPADFADGWPRPVPEPTRYARIGMGLVWQRCGPELAAVYDAPLASAEVEARIARYWQPYHAALAEEIAAARARHGLVLHLDCHSMPRLRDVRSPHPDGPLRPDVELSDLEGASCAPEVTAAAAEHLRGRGFRVTVNREFRGGEILRRHSRPAEGVHALQIEINRGLYLAEDRHSRSAGFPALRAEMALLTGRLAAFAREFAGSGGKVGA